MFWTTQVYLSQPSAGVGSITIAKQVRLQQGSRSLDNSSRLKSVWRHTNTQGFLTGGRCSSSFTGKHQYESALSTGSYNYIFKCYICPHLLSTWLIYVRSSHPNQRGKTGLKLSFSSIYFCRLGNDGHNMSLCLSVKGRLESPAPILAEPLSLCSLCRFKCYK